MFGREEEPVRLSNGWVQPMGVEAPMLECFLEAETHYVIGSPVDIRFTLANTGVVTQFVLGWYTPLEGILGEIFRVTSNGDEVAYRGILAKRGDPVREEYVSVAAEASVSSAVDLSSAYNLSCPGRYIVEYVAKLCDVTDDPGVIPRRRDDHCPVELPCTAVAFEMASG